MVPEKVTQGRFPQGAGMGGGQAKPPTERTGVLAESGEFNTHLEVRVQRRVF